jgi:endonuclease YncB( thermonuclease family)
MHRVVCFCLAFAALIFVDPLAASAQPRTVTGAVTDVRDCDTIVVGDTPVRLSGVHAPELSEPYGLQARDYVVVLTRAKTLTCVLDGGRTRDRWTGVCRTADNVDVAAALISAGFGRDCPRHSQGRYAHLDKPATVAAMPLPAHCLRFDGGRADRASDLVRNGTMIRGAR